MSKVLTVALHVVAETKVGEDRCEVVCATRRGSCAATEMVVVVVVVVSVLKKVLVKIKLVVVEIVVFNK